MCKVVLGLSLKGTQLGVFRGPEDSNRTVFRCLLAHEHIEYLVPACLAAHRTTGVDDMVEHLI